jgi:hypothetical protein
VSCPVCLVEDKKIEERRSTSITAQIKIINERRFKE